MTLCETCKQPDSCSANEKCFAESARGFRIGVDSHNENHWGLTDREHAAENERRNIAAMAEMGGEIVIGD